MIFFLEFFLIKQFSKSLKTHTEKEEKLLIKQKIQQQN